MMKAAMYICLAFLVSASAVAQERVKTIHVFVALCDNEHQGIVPVPAMLGNGEDPANNLYWARCTAPRRSSRGARTGRWS